MQRGRCIVVAMAVMQALVLAGCATAQQAADSPPAPHVWTGPFCGDEGCETYPMRVQVIGEAAVPVLDRPAMDAREIGRAPVGADLVIAERVMVLRYLRGVVTVGAGGLEAGDIIHRRYGPIEPAPGDPPKANPEDESSPFSLVYKNGQRVWLGPAANAAVIAWEEDTVRKNSNGIDDWRRIEPSGDQPGGWILEVGGIFCWAD